MRKLFLVYLQRQKMSSDDLLTKFDEIVKRFKKEFNEIIEGEPAKQNEPK